MPLSICPYRPYHISSGFLFLLRIDHSHVHESIELPPSKASARMPGIGTVQVPTRLKMRGGLRTAVRHQPGFNQVSTRFQPGFKGNPKISQVPQKVQWLPQESEPKAIESKSFKDSLGLSGHPCSKFITRRPLDQQHLSSSSHVLIKAMIDIHKSQPFFCGNLWGGNT